MPPTPDLRETYDTVAARWDRARSRAVFERHWLERFAALVPPAAPVLDVGCGAGEPIAAWLIARGLSVTGVDFAPAMLAIARARFPARRWIEADMRNLDLGEQFGGVIAWDSFFHLTRDEQRATILILARHLRPGGALILTTGPDEGERTGAVEGRPVFHASLSPAAYAAAFEAAGLLPRAFIAEDPACAGHSVWLAQRRL